VVQIAVKAVVDADVLAVIHAQVAADSPVVLEDQAVADMLVVLVDQAVAVTLVVLVDQVAAVTPVVLKAEAQVDLTAVVDSVRKAKAEIVLVVKENRSVETVNDHKIDLI
jgi:ribonuclease PH